MERSDLVESRRDVVKNIYKLYEYAHSDNNELREWAIDRYRLGKWFVVEPFGDKLMFAPSRFIGYKDNNWTIHSENPGSGMQTNDVLKGSDFYREIENEDTIERLIHNFNDFMSSFGLEKSHVNFLVPRDLSDEDLFARHNCYFITPTHCEGENQIAWQSFRNKGIMAMGWEDIDYSNVPLRKILEDYQNDGDGIKAFTNIMSIKHGDIVCCKNNRYGLWGIGIAMSGYKFEKGIHDAGYDSERKQYWRYSHYVDVAWICDGDKYIPTSAFFISDTESQWPPYGTLHKKDIPAYINDYIFNKRTIEMENRQDYSEYIELLKSNRNLILTGAPGTGKTYLAKQIAKAMGAETAFVQFHPSYDYTDFVEGLRPTLSDSKEQVGFERIDGIFKIFCRKALDNYEDTVRNIQNEIAIEAIKANIEDYSDFGIIYDILVKRIQNRTIVLYSDLRPTQMQPMKVRVAETTRYGWPRLEYEKTGRFENVNRDYLEKIYKYYVKRRQLDISGERFQDFINIIGNTLNYSFYRGIVQGMLDIVKSRLKEGEIKITSELNKSNSEYGDSQKQYVFIIDEINRGEISKIFGELFFSIDPGYRGESGRVMTQYQNMITDKNDPFCNGFYVPENVYIIGTMNDIDRSVESMDFAMRRRFAWKEVRASENTGMLDTHPYKEETISLMNRLNEEISQIDGLGDSFHIGGAYFTEDKLKDLSVESRTRMWNNHLKGVLFEYLRGMPDAAENLERLKDVFFA